MAKATTAPKVDPTAVTDPPPAADGGTTSALVRTSTDETSALATLAEAGFDSDDGEDGLAEVELGDLRTPLKLFNLKAADGVARITQDQFLDTIDRTVSDTLDLVLLDMHKTNRFEVFNNKEKRNETMCQSFDRVTGTYHDGRERPCKGCPDAQWRTVTDDQGNKKRTVPCGELWNVAAFDVATQRVCLLRFKKTSLDAIKSYVQAHHVGRLPPKRAGSKRGNIPLFAYHVRARLEMHKSGNHAIPKLERGAMLTAADMRIMHATAQGVRETFEARMRAADASAGADESGVDTSFDTDAMDAAGGAVSGDRGSEAFVE